jgi:hypothetical protein
MKILFAILLIFGTTEVLFSQELSQVTLRGGKDFNHFGIVIDRNILLRISKEGKILEYGMEEQSLRNPNYYASTLQPYIGRVDHYGNETDSLIRGKIKSIGTAFITYYPSYDDEYRRGKIRSIGNLMCDYFDNRGNEAQRGRLKQIGQNWIEYYPSFENEAYRGNLKNVGSTLIVYNSNFEDPAIRGKVKSIGTQNYLWYTSMERYGAGSLKSGPQRFKNGQILFIVQ